MDVSKDEIRRQLRDADREHLESLVPFGDAVRQAFTGAGEYQVSRRGLLVGGGALMSLALAACATHKPAAPVPLAGSNSTSTTTPRKVDDVTLLRTASSIEYLAVDTYQKAIDSGLVTNPSVVLAAKLFQNQHRDHANLFDTATKDANGQPFQQPNPAIQASVVAPALQGLKAEADVVSFAYALEGVAAATYQFFVKLLSKPELRAAIMSVGGVEARHGAILAGLIPNQPQVAGAFGNVSTAVGSNSFAY